MNVNVTKGRPEDYADIIDFGNMVFGEDFRAIQPKLYEDRPHMAKEHHLVWEDGRIKAMVGSFPITLQVAGRTIPVRGIGTVSVHPYARSKGYMKLLMANALQEAEQEGAALMVLGGRRQRYEHFGFTKCGTSFCFGLNPVVRRQLKHIPSDEVQLLPLGDSKEYLRDCVQLWESQPMAAVRRPENFCATLQTGAGTGYVILLRGEFLGFCSMHKGDKSGYVSELFLKEYSFSANVAMKLCEEMAMPFSVFAFPHQTGLIHALNLIAESASCDSSPSFNVLDYPRVIEAFLTLKGMNTPLADGRLVLEVTEKGRYAIEVQQGRVTVTETEDKPLIALPHLQMMCWLFSPFGQFGGQVQTPETRSWLPIPLYLPGCDDV